MKKILLMLCFLFAYALNSQQTEMFDYDTVINLTSATTLQQQDYKLAISKREEALKNDSLKSNESTLSINKAFKAKFNDIFEEDQLNEFYKTQIDKEYVDLIATEEFERLIFKFDFPEDYLSTIKKRFLDLSLRNNSQKKNILLTKRQVNLNQ